MRGVASYTVSVYVLLYRFNPQFFLLLLFTLRYATRSKFSTLPPPPQRAGNSPHASPSSKLVGPRRHALRDITPPASAMYTGWLSPWPGKVSRSTTGTVNG